MKLHKVEDTDSRILWASDPVNHGDWPFAFLVVLEHVEDWSRESAIRNGRYHVSVRVASPEAAKEKIPNVCKSMGMDEKNFRSLSFDWQCVTVADYGCVAVLWQNQGNNAKKLLRESRAELKMADFLFGFYMDRRQNAVGATGWDFVRGKCFPSAKDD